MIEKVFIRQGMNKVELDKYLSNELYNAGFTKSEIMKTPLVTRIVVNVTRPGLAIGKSGSNIIQLTETIGKKFGIDNPQLEIKEIEKPELDAQAVANKFKALIERGFSWRSVVFKTMNDIQNAGASGVEIIVSGKLAGKGGRKRKQRIAFGYMKKVGEQAKLVEYGYASAYPKVGAIGIKVKIVRPETIFPDKELIADYIKRIEDVAQVKGEATEKTKKDESEKKKEEGKDEKTSEKKEEKKEVKKESEKKGEEKEVKAMEKKEEPKADQKEEKTEEKKQE